MIYIITYLSILFFSLSEIISNNKKTFSAIFITLILFLIAIFRTNTGTDFQSYVNLWNNVNLFNPDISSQYGYVEIGMRFIISVLKLLTKSDFLFFTLLAAIPLYFFFKAIKYLKLPVSISLFFYYTFFYFAYLFNGMGQAITISLMLFSIKYIIEKKFWKVLALSIAGTLIHYSGIAILLLYFLMNININITNTKVFFISVFGGIILQQIHFTNHLLDFVFPEKFSVYYSFFSKESSIFQVLTKLLIFLVFFLFTFKIKDNLYQNLFKAYSFGILLFLSLLEQNVLATRIFMMFKPLEILMILLLIQHSKNLFTRLTIFFVFSIPYTYQFLLNINNPEFLYNFRF